MTLLLALLLMPGSTYGQITQVKVADDTDTTKKTRIEIVNTDVFEFTTTDSNQVRQFTGNVHFRHEGTDFFCGQAVQFMDTEIVIATGDVHIQKPDSFDVWADYLVYYSRTKIAKFRGDVIFQDSTARLMTDSLDYNLDTDIGYFWGGGALKTDTSLLTSEAGTYYHRRREAVFKGDVHLSNPEFDLYSDSMRYDTKEQIAWFIAPTKIVNEGDVIVTNTGYYDTKENKAMFGGDTELESGSTKISANQLIYDKDIGYGEATGNVIWEDTAEQITILANYSEYKDSNDYVMATLDPLLIDANDEDTLYLSADTLVTYKAPVYVLPDPDTIYVRDSSEQLLDTLVMQIVQDTVPVATGDSVRIFYAHRNTRLLNGRMSGVCDSMFFSQGDSVFRLHGDPLMWVDTTQFSGDSMHMVLRNGGLDRIYIFRNALIVHENSPGVYDQTKGKLVTGIFRDDELKQMEVVGNGESIYFIQDDSSAFIGGNKSLCSKMILYMNDSTNDVENITFLTKPEATFTPMSMIQLAVYNLEGFRWEIGLKPVTVYDVVRYLPLYQYYLRREKAKKPVVIISEEEEEVPESKVEPPEPGALE